MTEEQRRKYSCIIASIDGRLTCILDLGRDELLEAFCQLREHCDEQRQLLIEAGYPGPP